MLDTASTARASGITESLAALALEDSQPTGRDPQPPSVGEIDNSPEHHKRIPPPVPTFAASSSGKRVLDVFVDGQKRQGVVDSQGRIRIEGPLQFDIGSDEEDEMLPQFGDGNSKVAAGPFAPNAASPFQESPDHSQKNAGSMEVSQAIPPPPPPPEATWGFRGNRRRSPSPRTPNTRPVPQYAHIHKNLLRRLLHLMPVPP